MGKTHSCGFHKCRWNDSCGGSRTPKGCRVPPSERGDVGGADRGEYCGLPSHIHGATTRTVRGSGPTARMPGSYMPLAVTEGRMNSPGETARTA